MSESSSENGKGGSLFWRKLREWDGKKLSREDFIRDFAGGDTEHCPCCGRTVNGEQFETAISELVRAGLVAS